MVTRVFLRGLKLTGKELATGIRSFKKTRKGCSRKVRSLKEDKKKVLATVTKLKKEEKRVSLASLVIFVAMRKCLMRWITQCHFEQ